MSLCEKLKKVKVVLVDVDGVLNDGKLYYLPAEGGVQTAKFFNVKDGLSVRLLKLAGVKFGVVTGRSDAVVKKRCDELNCDYYFYGVKDKGKAVAEVIRRESNPTRSFSWATTSTT